MTPTGCNSILIDTSARSLTPVRESRFLPIEEEPLAVINKNTEILQHPAIEAQSATPIPL